MVKWALSFLFCMLLDGCFVNQALNYPFRGQEIIASFPIDPNTMNKQDFELDGIRTEKTFIMQLPSNIRLVRQEELDTNKYLGPYGVSLCMDDSVYEEARFDVRIVVTLSSFEMEAQKDTNALHFTGVACDHGGWSIGSFRLPRNFDLDQRVIVSFQVLEDREKYLGMLTNPRLVVVAGRGSVK